MGRESSKHRHLYGSQRWRVFSERFRKANPLCVRCLENGKVQASEVTDHVRPHKGDETAYWAGPFQALCKSCHDLKSIGEDASAEGVAQTHPEWLPKPRCPVVLVCGPSGGGKTTWAQEQAGAHDVFVDLDDCFTEVCGTHGHEADRKHLSHALRYRNKLLANLANKATGKAYFIVSAPSRKERDWWAEKLSAQVHCVDPGLRVIEQRITGTRLQAAKAWYARAKSNDWHNPNRQGFNEDGTPVGGWA